MWTRLRLACWGQRAGSGWRGARSQRGRGAGSGAQDTLPAWGFLPLPRRGEQGGVFDPVVPVCERALVWGLVALSFPSLFGGRGGVEVKWLIRPSPLRQRREVECLLCAGMGVEFSELGRRCRGAAPSWACGWGLLSVCFCGCGY